MGYTRLTHWVKNGNLLGDCRKDCYNKGSIHLKYGVSMGTTGLTTVCTGVKKTGTIWAGYLKAKFIAKGPSHFHLNI